MGIKRGIVSSRHRFVEWFYSFSKTNIDETRATDGLAWTESAEIDIEIDFSFRDSYTALEGVIGKGSFGGSLEGLWWLHRTGETQCTVWLIEKNSGPIITFDFTINAVGVRSVVKILNNEVFLDGVKAGDLTPTTIDLQSAVSTKIGLRPYADLNFANIDVYNYRIGPETWGTNEGSGFVTKSKPSNLNSQGSTSNPSGLTYWNSNVWSK